MAARRRELWQHFLRTSLFKSTKQLSSASKAETVDRGRFRAYIAPRGVASQGTSLSPLLVLRLTETKVKAGEMGKPLENGFEQDEFGEE